MSILKKQWWQGSAKLGGDEAKVRNTVYVLVKLKKVLLLYFY